MAKQRYKNIGLFPLDFGKEEGGRQMVECDEEFERDFAASKHPEQEAYLMNNGIIKRATPPAPPPAEIQRAVHASRQKKEKEE